MLLRDALARTILVGCDEATLALGALEDAAESLRDRISYCPACTATALCEDCTGRQEQAWAYDLLAGELRKILPADAEGRDAA